MRQSNLWCFIPGSPWHDQDVIEILGKIHLEKLKEIVTEVVEYQRVILELIQEHNSIGRMYFEKAPSF